MLNKLMILLLIFVLPLYLNAYQLKTRAKQAVILDLASDSFIFEHNADEKFFPSSMSKLMTLYITFDYLKAGIINMQDKFEVSRKAWKIGGSSMYLKEGQKVTVEDLLKGAIISSGNDACITLAEAIAGSEKNFVTEMNEVAQKFNLNNSNFMNSSGIHNENHFMSAKDLAKLAQKIFSDFPEYYYLFSEKDFTFNSVEHKNQNTLIFHNIGVDGIKTGHSDSGDYGIVVSANQNNKRIFITINGLGTARERIEEAKKLVQYYFKNFNTRTIFRKNSKIEEIDVLYGQKKKVPITVEKDIVITYNRNIFNKIKVYMEYQNDVIAPIKKGQEIGKLHIEIPGMEKQVVPLYIAESIEELGMIGKLFSL
ncbi:D-alanyl-D-alanine carboxypeptidase family protein [Wolbachia endosymbiont of Pentidionis agamae]|uniref:D-alanyl-D-alanine carboxypeptidase family protein n=1 Tax=Wolbachia endosymbiont of Pentidionis agamae TaxID=3110435 RepID=UPI002FD7644D